MPNTQIQPANSQFILYQDDSSVTNVNIRFDGNAFKFNPSQKNRYYLGWSSTYKENKK